MSTQIQYLEKDGVPEYAVVPIDTYRELLALAEDAEDIRAADEAKASDDELIPAEVVNALMDDENPVKVWRKYRGLSQAELAKLAGVSQAYIGQIETGVREGTVSVYKAIAGVMELDLDDLV